MNRLRKRKTWFSKPCQVKANLPTLIILDAAVRVDVVFTGPEAGVDGFGSVVGHAVHGEPCFPGNGIVFGGVGFVVDVGDFDVEDGGGVAA
jgi:hypothetical protein